MKVTEFIELIRSAILYNIDLGSLAEVEVRRRRNVLGYIAGITFNDYRITMFDNKYQRRKLKVIDLLSELNRAKNQRGRSDKDVIYSPRRGYNYDIVSVYFKLERCNRSVKYIKFYINVQ